VSSTAAWLQQKVPEFKVYVTRMCSGEGDITCIKWLLHRLVYVHLSKRRGPDDAEGNSEERDKAKSIESRGPDGNRDGPKEMACACVQRVVPRLALVPRAQGQARETLGKRWLTGSQGAGDW
jgi:hypothetical protein